MYENTCVYECIVCSAHTKWFSVANNGALLKVMFLYFMSMGDCVCASVCVCVYARVCLCVS